MLTGNLKKGDMIGMTARKEARLGDIERLHTQPFTE